VSCALFDSKHIVAEKLHGSGRCGFSCGEMSGEEDIHLAGEIVNKYPL
jgi:hypothetical protein